MRVVAIRQTSYLSRVASAARLGVADVDAVLGIVAEAAAAQGEHPFELPLVDRLAKLVPADQAGYYEYRVHTGWTTVDLHIVKQPWHELDWSREEVTAAWPFWPLHDRLHQHTTTAVRFSDGLSQREKRRNPWYTMVMRSHVEHEMRLWLPSPSGVVRGFFFVRAPGRHDFQERDRAVLNVLRPHLAAIRERWQRRRHPPGLTDRETQVLQLLRQGLTNQEIADRLVIATGTVRTHLEHIYDKLDAHTRTQAIAQTLHS